MRLKASVYAVIRKGERVTDFDTRAEAEAHVEQHGGEVRLLDRRRSQPKVIPEGVLVLLMGATAEERERALAIYR